MRRKFWLKFYDKINVNSAKKLKKEDTLKTPSTVPHFEHKNDIIVNLALTYWNLLFF